MIINSIGFSLFMQTREAHESSLDDLIGGGFRDRGVLGMILAAKYARENNIPCLVLCLGMQVSVIEFSRSVSLICFSL